MFPLILTLPTTLSALQGEDHGNKYFKRGDLIAKEQEEYLQKYRPNANIVQSPSTSDGQRKWKCVPPRVLLIY